MRTWVLIPCIQVNAGCCDSCKPSTGEAWNGEETRRAPEPVGQLTQFISELLVQRDAISNHMMERNRGSYQH